MLMELAAAAFALTLPVMLVVEEILMRRRTRHGAPRPVQARRPVVRGAAPERA